MILLHPFCLSLCVLSCCSISARAPFVDFQEPQGIFSPVEGNRKFLKMPFWVLQWITQLCSFFESSECCSLCLHLQSFKNLHGVGHLCLTSNKARSVQTWCLSQRGLTLSPCFVPLCDVPSLSSHRQLCRLTSPFPAVSPYTHCPGL